MNAFLFIDYSGDLESSGTKIRSATKKARRSRRASLQIAKVLKEVTD